MNVCKSLLLLSVLFPRFLLAQDDVGDIAYPAPKMPNDPNLAKVAMLRLWYVGAPNTPGITLAREVKSKPATVIESGIKAGLFSAYVAQKPGEFILHILDGSVKAPASPEEKLPLEEKKLVDPIEVQMPPGSYLTLIVRQDADGKFTSELLEDKRFAPGEPVQMRVRNLSDLKGWSVELTDRQDQPVQQLWDEARGDAPVTITQKGVYRIVVKHKTGEGIRTAGVLETELASGTGFTVVIFPGEAGTGATGLYFDAFPGNGYFPELIKKVAEGK